MFETRRRCNDGRFFLSVMAFCLDTIKCNAGDKETTKPLLAIAVQWCDRFDFHQLTPHLHDCCMQIFSVLFVYRVLALYEEMDYDGVLHLLKSTKEQPVEFDVEQSESLARVCFNVGLNRFDAQQFESALIWLKFAYTYGNGISKDNPIKSFEIFSIEKLNRENCEVKDTTPIVNLLQSYNKNLYVLFH